MASPETPKPAREVSAEPVSGLGSLRGSKQPSSNTPPKPAKQAPPADRGEDDLTFFSRRPYVSTRTRVPFKGEFPPGVLEPGRTAFVYVTIERDRAGNPGTRARAIFYSSIDGGRA